ncbi:MAG: 7-carboxy-7-deazaguanine synthase QueE [Flavobacteriales bacterium]|nr:7-carboxy-7-deazaguanine synthase QueE [Flavobacteriales bacterium]
MAATTQNKLPLMEAFYTLQGEGHYTGRAAYFIRLGGCDVGCHWCDVKESWNAGDHPETSTDLITQGAIAHKSRFTVITGGEPFMYDLNELCSKLTSKGFELAVETSGAYPLSGNWHWICLSPKKTKPPIEEFYQQANELKIIIYNQSDFKWAEEHATKVNENCKLYLQVEWSKREEMTPSIIEYIKHNPKWSISVQSHKYLNIP